MLNEFDFDPDQFVPALLPGEPGYTPELDANNTSRDQRAQWFHKQFIFIVAPNSVLAMDAQERKMMRVQLARMGYYDFWSLHETLETPNVGAPPAHPAPAAQSAAARRPRPDPHAGAEHARRAPGDGDRHDAAAAVHRPGLRPHVHG